MDLHEKASVYNVESLNKSNLPMFLKSMSGEYLWISSALQSMFKSSIDSSSIIGKTDADCSWSIYIEMINYSDRLSQKHFQYNPCYEFHLLKDGFNSLKFSLLIDETQWGILCLVCNGRKECCASLINDVLRSQSHDLRMPINSAIGHLQLCGYLLEKGDIPQAKKMIKKSMSSVIAIMSTSENFRMSSVNSTQKFALFPVMQYEVDMSQALTQLNQNIQIVYNISSDVPTEFHINLYKFQQILRNLLSNAIKNTREGLVKINVNTHGENLLIHISDTGCGMSKEYQEYVKMISQVSGKNIKPNRGLDIIFKNIKDIGGSIQYDFSVEQGTLVKFQIPI